MVKSKRYFSYAFFKAARGDTFVSSAYKPIISNFFIDNTDRSFLFTVFAAQKKNYLSQFKHNCLVTGRMRGVLTKFLMSRIVFKAYAISGILPGLKKARWLWFFFQNFVLNLITQLRRVKKLLRRAIHMILGRF